MEQRFDLYAFVHKGIRHLMQAALLRLGQMDVEDRASVSAGLDALEEMLQFLEQHMVAEEVVHAAVERREPGRLVGTLRDDHAGHRRAIATLRHDAASFARTESEPAPARQARARHLYLEASRFVAENLLHMAVEETDMNAVLWRLFDDTELMGVWAAIMAKETPEQLTRGVKWIIPAVSSDERVQIVAGARMTMAPAVFAQLLPYVRSLIPEAEAQKLAAALG